MDQIIAANGYPTMAARYWLESEENPSRRTGERAREKGKKHRYVRCFSLRKFQQKKRKHHIIDDFRPLRDWEQSCRGNNNDNDNNNNNNKNKNKTISSNKKKKNKKNKHKCVAKCLQTEVWKEHRTVLSTCARTEHVNNTKAHTTITLMASPVCEALQYGYNMGYNGDIINTVYRIWVCLKMGHSLKWQFQIGIVTINSALVIRRTSVSGISWLAFRCHLLSGWGSYGHRMAPSCTITSLTWKKHHQREADGGFPRSLSKTRWTFFKNRGCLWGCR